MVPGINEEEQLFEEISTCNKLAAINEAARAAEGARRPLHPPLLLLPLMLLGRPARSTNIKHWVESVGP